MSKQTSKFVDTYIMFEKPRKKKGGGNILFELCISRDPKIRILELHLDPFGSITIAK